MAPAPECKSGAGHRTPLAPDGAPFPGAPAARAAARWSALAVERELRSAVVERPVAHFAGLIGDRVVDRVGANVAPVAIEAVGGGRGPRTLDLEQTAGGGERGLWREGLCP